MVQFQNYCIFLASTKPATSLKSGNTSYILARWFALDEMTMVVPLHIGSMPIPTMLERRSCVRSAHMYCEFYCILYGQYYAYDREKDADTVKRLQLIIFIRVDGKNASEAANTLYRCRSWGPSGTSAPMCYRWLACGCHVLVFRSGTTQM